MKIANNPYQWLEKSLDTIHRANWYRSPKTISGLPGAIIKWEGRSLINFASNDYLGLAGDSRLIQAAMTAIAEFGTGSTGSRLLTGHRRLHRELEQAIASLKQTEDALVFSSGYLANLGAITAVVNHKDLILADRYNHSSLKNGAKMSSATILPYNHGDITELATKLAENRAKYRRCLIITDSVFSMDGDLCQLPEIVNLAESFDSMLLVDEAHATGVMGNTGAGVVEHYGLTGKDLIQIGTLSKALGSLGGYVAGSAKLIDFLRNRASTWIYTTGLSPADTAAALAAIKIIQTEPQRRKRLWEHVELCKNTLSDWQILPTESPIICLGLASAEEALTIAQQLQEAGILIAAIRPPTVPTSRLRISIMATHTREQIRALRQGLLGCASV